MWSGTIRLTVTVDVEVREACDERDAEDVAQDTLAGYVEDGLSTDHDCTCEVVGYHVESSRQECGTS